jgi:FkbM family methyltransferase
MSNRPNHVSVSDPSNASIEIPGIGSITLALHTKKDIWISDVIRRGELFDSHILGVLPYLVLPGTTLIDIGANIGWFTVIGSRMVGLDGQVIAIEPDPENLRLLHWSVAHNGCRNVTIFPYAAGAEARTAQLFRSEDNQGDHRLEVVSERAESIMVLVRPLDALIEQVRHDVNVVKIDTQGSECAILRGMQRLLVTCRQMRIVLEFWPFGLLRCGSSAEELVNLLGQRNSSLWLLSADGTVEQTSPEGLRELAATRFAPATQAHADLIWLASDDQQAVDAMHRLARPDSGV